ncbi:PREDICTED: uncharacterized protein LOC107073752, partial [Polistes dominula]|uniref:Uncharacterized protein LOC107073752 n=1 Tax=Polistes dominula TaxID=743375 RepID=A0ABM1JBU8_POLDO
RACSLLRRVEVWMKHHSLQLVPNKTEAVIIKGRRRRDLYFRLDWTEVIPVKVVKYLCIMIDYRLSFRKHFDRIVTKAEQRAATLTRFMPNIGGPSTKKILVLCGVIHSIILYGALIWSGALKYKKYRDMLGRVQRK